MNENDLKPNTETIDYQDLKNKDILSECIFIPGTSAATSANYGRFITLNRPIQIISIQEIHETAGTDGGAVTLDVVVVNDGSAISTGTSLLSSTFNLKSTANTLVRKQKRDLSSARKIEPNQTIALKTSGTLTAVAGVCVTVFYQFYAKGSYKL
jgi:activator of 2-hydroxyglutaryl-CoA dehydratase